MAAVAAGEGMAQLMIVDMRNLEAVVMFYLEAVVMMQQIEGGHMVTMVGTSNAVAGTTVVLGMATSGPPKQVVVVVVMVVTAVSGARCHLPDTIHGRHLHSDHHHHSHQHISHSVGRLLRVRGVGSQLHALPAATKASRGISPAPASVNAASKYHAAKEMLISDMLITWMMMMLRPGISGYLCLRRRLCVLTP